LYTGDQPFLFPIDRSDVAKDRATAYCMLSMGLSARRDFLMTFGVMARLTVLPGCTARRTPRGATSLERKPMTVTIHQ
jgi:hypothetical protein